jgi:formate dehydrogenase major subunit
MPANGIEIAEAEEEGVIFKNLTNPIEITGDNNKVTGVRLQVMKLGEPDASGRRSPVPVEGKEEFIEADAVITAIGLKTDNAGLEALELSGRGTIIADGHTYMTNLDGVFAVGDAVNNGADIAVAAVGGARLAAEFADKYLQGGDLKYAAQYLAKTEKTAADFADREKIARVIMPHRTPGERGGDFLEVNLGLSEEYAVKEARRCLECGCHDYPECKLVKYAGNYNVNPEKYGVVPAGKPAAAAQIPGVRGNPDKCILCGLCVRVCEEVAGAGILGFVGRRRAVRARVRGLRWAVRGCVPDGRAVKIA